MVGTWYTPHSQTLALSEIKNEGTSALDLASLKPDTSAMGVQYP